MTNYLTSKKLTRLTIQYGLRECKGPFNGWEPFGHGVPCLLIPALDFNGKLHTLQFISPRGEKRFYPGGKKKGNFYPIGVTKNPEVLYIVEGIATGLTINQIDKVPVIVAFDANNLTPVAESMRWHYPNVELVIAGDNDWTKPKNKGKHAAELAAERSSTSGNITACIIPDFTGLPATEKHSDFNDLAILRGDL